MEEPRPEAFWALDPLGLVHPPERLTRFVPQPGAPLEEQLNAALRFAVLWGAGVLLTRGSLAGMYAPLLVAGATYLVWRGERGVSEGMAREQGGAPTCTAPTRDNPFMNVLMSDYAAQPERPAACDPLRPDVAHAAERLFEQGLFRDVDDAFDRRASSQPFYTMPSTTIPNDQAGFARWLYSTGPTRKERH